MKQISDMGEQEKSAMLARVCGWLNPAVGYRDGIWRFDTHGFSAYDNTFYKGPNVPSLNVYDLPHMPLAWRVMGGFDEVAHVFGDAGADALSKFGAWWDRRRVWEYKEPEYIQGLWLDKILELAIDAKMLEVNGETDTSE